MAPLLGSPAIPWGCIVRLKLVLEASGQASRDVVVSCDTTVTVSELAHAFSSSIGTARHGTALSLWLDPVDGTIPRVLNPLLSVHDSGIRSGARVAVAEAALAVPNDGTSAAVAEVIGGPDQGSAFPLSPGVNFIGRDPAADVCLNDHLVSRRHAKVDVGAGIVVTDLNSANGLEVAGERVDQAVVSIRDRVRIGNSILRFTLSPGRSRVQVTAPVFGRSPRVVEPWLGTEVPAPVLPEPSEKPRLPWIALVAPIVAGASLFALTKNPLMLLFVALSPVLMLGTWIDQRIRHRRQLREATARFEEGLEKLEAELEQLSADEQAARLREAPSTAEVGDAIRSRSSLLWTRLPEHASFLSLRLGTGTLPSRTKVLMPPRRLEAQPDWSRLSAVVTRFDTVDDVPVVERLADAGALGVTGGDFFATDVARALLLQIAGLHSPAEVAIAAFALGEAADEWEWLKWLPHTDGPHSPLRTALADDSQRGARLLAELEELVMLREAGGRPGDQVRSHLTSAQPGSPGAWDAVQKLPTTPAVIVLVAGETGVDRGRLVALANTGADVGVHVIWLGAAPADLPVVCRTYVDVQAAIGSVSFVRHGRSVALTGLELCSREQAVELSKALAPLEDHGAPVLDESDIPTTVSLVDLFEDDIAGDPAAIAARWSRNDTLMASWAGSPRHSRGLSALVGQGADAPFRIDLRRDGPHALVGGTTGSGKSEFLQAWILGLAVEQSPDRLTFLLVDYKGGSAFGECARLPHTVGLVTDLTPHLAHRALTSLRAELRRREEILQDKGAKDLIALEERGDADAPPVLVIVIDEFAALVSEVPEFVDGVVDIAQRGRSLGIHLIMATQRPAGVIRDNLRANTNLRVALRVADTADSVDVLGVDRAARFDPATPGRAAAKLGAGKVRDFQAAYIGGRTGRTRTSEIEIRDLPFAPGAAWPALTRQTNGTGPRDVERMTSTIGQAAVMQRLREPRRPWLEQLADALDLPSQPSMGALAVGMQDEPDKQLQQPLLLDLENVGNVAVFGAGNAGKTVALRTITAAAACSTEEVWVYAIDAAGGALSSMRMLPHVGAVISVSDVERVRRLVAQLQDWTAERARLLAAVDAATLAEYNLRGPSRLPRVVVMIDGIGSFRAEYEYRDGGRLFDALTALMATGRQVGVHFVLTADRHAALPQSLHSAVHTRVVLRMAADADYDMLGVPRTGLLDAPPGRGFVRNTEVQFAVPGGEPDLVSQNSALAALSETATTAPPIRRLAERISLATIAPATEGRPTIGIADDTLTEVGMPSGLFVITGPFGSGRSTAMRTAVLSTGTAYPEMPRYLLSARPGELVEAVSWTEVATDSDSAESLASRLASDLSGPTLIVVEGSSEFEGTAAEGAVARLLKAARRNLHTRVIVETDTVTAGAAWQLHTELKTARAGIVLQPEDSDGASLFRVQFPRATRADFPPGRGFFVDSGRVRTVQVAIVEADAHTTASALQD